MVICGGAPQFLGNATLDKVAIAAGALLLLGPDVIFGLTIAVFLGIFVGTYSSIYIAAPALIYLGVGRRENYKDGAAKGPRGARTAKSWREYRPS